MSEDMAGFAEMISGYAHVANLGRKLVFLNPTEKIYKLVINAKLHCVFEFFDDKQKALEGCAQPGILIASGRQLSLPGLQRSSSLKSRNDEKTAL
jgi:hypothetical protein